MRPLVIELPDHFKIGLSRCGLHGLRESIDCWAEGCVSRETIRSTSQATWCLSDLGFAERAEMRFISRRMGVGLSCLFLLTVPLFLSLPADAQQYTVLHAFAESDGQVPLAGLVQGTDGNFYGTTNQGGARGAGTVFKITPSWTLTTLYPFAGSDGSY